MLELRASSRSLKRTRAIVVALAILGQLGLGMAQAAPVNASFPQGSGIGQEQGFDACTDPTQSQMGTWWSYSPYYWLGAYIGGSEMLCSQPNLSATWLQNTLNQGWGFEFLWVGLQAPCTTYKYRFSSNTSTAFSQGQQEAINAVNELILNLGVQNPAQFTAVTFDLDAAPAACQSATNAFISGWDYQLSLSPAQESGVYGAVCYSNMQALANISHVPTFIWGGDGDGEMTTKDLWNPPGNCGVTDGVWIYSQRIKQYVIDNYESWGGVALTVDENCDNTWTNPYSQGTNSGCIAAGDE